ncbi:MAG TPA: Hint domain-containing protein [Acetobacteraceae bacterium]
MATLTVGPGQQYATIEAAVAAAASGDTVDVQAGIYTNDFVGIFKNLTLQAVGGVVRMVATEAPSNRKAIIDEGGAGVVVTINGFDISGAAVSDGNGAAVRYEGGSLTLDNDYFHDNQDGMLAAADPNGTITINNSEFAFNGTGDGKTHNLYVNEIALLTITGSYFHDAVMGHEIKSRAEDTVITNSRIFDNLGTASYSIDLPNGGDATITNDVIEQGPNGQNPNIIAYGEEGSLLAGTSVLIADNTIVNGQVSASARVVFNQTPIPLSFQNNQIWGLTAAQLSSGPLAEIGTTFLTTAPTLNTASTWAIGLLCFLAGTRIATPMREVRVEELAVGDMVRTIGGGVKTIVWIGVGRTVAVRGRRNAATPVIVRKGALADNVPHRDLRVTKGHALYIDDALIPIECLVNHRSITWDDHAQEVELYHIELETHDVLLANGAPAESYRDDGNRWLFQNANDGWGAPAKEPCAPVLTDGPVVDRVWRRLLERAGPRPGIPLTDDPDLHLLVDGRRTEPDRRGELQYVFRLAARPDEVRVVSHASAPQELGLVRDPRSLGVALRQIVVQGVRTLTVGADDERLTEGFYRFEEANRIRWTNGDAVVPTGLFADFTGAMELTLHLGCTTTYADVHPRCCPTGDVRRGMEPPRFSRSTTPAPVPD